MELNANFDERVAVHTQDLEWQPSPMPGVDRRMLDRLGNEVARATSIVRYAPGSNFSPHVHTGGEEFFVLDGVFQDEHGDFPAGSYVRNPPESSHKPGSEAGCTIFVKLWQFDLTDRTQVHVDTNTAHAVSDPTRPNVSITPLFKDANEEVLIEHWRPESEIALEASDGAELLVLEGGFEQAGETFAEHSWLRLPKNGSTNAIAGPSGARVWIKRGHLADPPQPPAV